MAEAARRDRDARVPRLSLESGRRKEPAHRHLSRQPARLRADDSRRPDLDQEQHRSDADLPPLVPRGRLRLLRDEHRRPEHARLHARDGRGGRGADQGQSAAASAGGEGPGAGPDEFLRAVRLDRAVAEDHLADAAEGMAAEPRRPAEARRTLRVHPLRLLLDLVPELLVEQRPLPRSRRAAAGKPLGQRFAR